MKVKLSITNPVQSNLICAIAQVNQVENSLRRLNLEPEESLLHWRLRNPENDHFGTISFMSGNLSVRNKEIVGGALLLDMDSTLVESCSSKNQAKQLECRYKGSDELHSDKYPTALFEFNEVVPIVDTLYTVRIHGMLTFKGITYPVTIRARRLERMKPIYYVTETIRFHFVDGQITSASNLTTSTDSCYCELSATLRFSV